MQDFNQFPHDMKPIDWTKVLKILLCLLVGMLIIYLAVQIYCDCTMLEYYRWYSDLVRQFALE